MCHLYIATCYETERKTGQYTEELQETPRRIPKDPAS